MVSTNSASLITDGLKELTGQVGRHGGGTTTPGALVQISLVDSELGKLPLDERRPRIKLLVR